MHSRTHGRVAARSLLPLLGISCLFAAACTAQVGPESSEHSSAASTKGVRGDINGDGRGDIALTGGASWNTLPVAFSNGNGTFSVTNTAISQFATYATQGAAAVSGDFDGDGHADVALTGGFIPGSSSPWNTIPVAFSKGDGSFRVTNDVVSGFPTYATQTYLSPVVGDFNGDGRDDIALAGGPGWNTIPVAFSNGDGTFNVTNYAVTSFDVFAQQGARLLAADFDGDGRSDLALTGGLSPVQGSLIGTPWTTLPVAFSNGNGTFRVTNYTIANFATYATQGALPVTGDFDGDGRGDIALTGGHGWGTVPVAFSNGNGTFRVTNTAVANFPVYAAESSLVQVVAADFDGDGKSDLALTGGSGWTTIPVAFSNGNGSFHVTNDSVASFPVFATQVSYPHSPTAVSASEARYPLPAPIQ
jgi:hypothetical protein